MHLPTHILAPGTYAARRRALPAKCSLKREFTVKSGRLSGPGRKW